MNNAQGRQTDLLAPLILTKF